MSTQTPVKLTAKQRRAQEQAKREQEQEIVKKALNSDAKTDEQKFGLTALRRAQDIRSRHDALVKERAGNRDMLRAMVAQGLVTEEVAAAVTVFYPEPKANGDDDTPDTSDTTTPDTTTPAPKSAPKTPPAQQ